MRLEINIPEAVCGTLQKKTKNLSQAALEALAVESYRTRVLTAFQVRQMLGHRSRMVTLNFLAEHGVYPNYTLESVIEDLASLDRVMGP